MTGSVRTFERGIALIVEGATEKMFYQVYLERCCDACPPAHMDKELLDGDVCFEAAHTESGSSCFIAWTR